jgi:hypothetical protein
MFLVSFALSGAFATPPDIGAPRAIILDYAIEPVKIGEKTFIPVQIDRLDSELKSAKIWFEFNLRVPLQEGVSPNSVKIENAVVDASKLTSFPYTVYVPMVVTGEGLFDFKGNIIVEAPDGEKFRNDESNWNVSIGNLGIFAFEGEVSFGRDRVSALGRVAVHRFQKINPEYIELFNKKESIDKGILKENFSEEESERLRKLTKEERDNIAIRYFEKYPPDPSLPVHIKNRPSPASKP